MIDVVNTPEGGNPVRVISTTPRERWEGHWQRGRRYPLYSVVENNGSKFMSLTGNMKEEPYVLYDSGTQTFSANDGWVIKEMSADSRLTAIGGNATIGLASVTASVDGNPGLVYVTVGGTPEAKIIDFAFSGLKGTPGTSIKSVVQTSASGEDGEYNEITITLDDGSVSKVYVKNGEAGRVGVTEAHATTDALVSPTPTVNTTLTDDGALYFAFSGLKGIQGNPGVNNTTMVVTEDIYGEDASEDTMDIVFLQYNDDTGEYDRYITQYDGSTYSFVQIGDTSLDLSDYQRKDDEVWLTQAEFDALEIKDITKVYNVYEEASEL